jgi:hypothetical protein
MAQSRIEPSSTQSDFSGRFAPGIFRILLTADGADQSEKQKLGKQEAETEGQTQKAVTTDGQG